MYNVDKIKTARKSTENLQDAIRRRLTNTYGSNDLNTIYKPRKKKES